MKSFLGLALLVVIAGASVCSAQSVVPGVQVVPISPEVIALKVTPRVSGYDTLATESSTVIRPIIEGAMQKGLAGASEYWVITVPVAVPSPSSFALTVSENQHTTLTSARLPRVQERVKTAHGIEYTSQLSFANIEYGQPTPSIAYIGLSGHTHIAHVTIPVAFAGPSGAVIAKETVVQVHLAGASITPKPRGASIPGVVYPDFAEERASTSFGNTSKHRDQILVEPNAPMVKVSIGESGMYRITADELAEAGLEVQNDQVDFLSVFGNGGHELPERIVRVEDTELIEQPVYVHTNSDGSLKEIVMYGQAARGVEYSQVHGFRPWQNAFSNQSHYLITLGTQPGMRAQERQEPLEAADFTYTSVTGFTVHEKDLFNPYSPGSGRRWFGEAIDKSIPTTFVTTLPGLVAMGTVDVVASIAHTDVATSQIQIEESGQTLAPVSMSRVYTSSYEVAYATTVKREVLASSISGNQARLQLQYSAGSGSLSGSAYVDWFMYAYPRSLKASNQELFFGSSPNQNGVVEMVLSEFGANRVYAFDVTDAARPVALRNLSGTGGLCKIKEEIDQPRLYFASSKLRQPTAITEVETIGLRSQPLNTELIVITHNSLMESAKRYQEFRQSHDGMSVSVVDVEHIYNEYGYGTADPGAIRDFLAHALGTWDVVPQYVLLWGDGHYDYKGITTAVPNLIPTWQNYDNDGKLDAVDSTYLTEDFFALLNGDDSIPDIAIGRMAVSSEEQGMVVVDKIIHYETASSVDDWRSRITLIADDSWAKDRNDRSLHTGQSEDLSNSEVYIPGGMKQKKIYLPEFSTENIPGGLRKPKVNQALVNAVNNGSVLLNWIGHGNPKVWAHERIFVKDETVPLFRNNDKLFFLTAATCDFGRFDDIENRSSGAEDLIHSESGGAIGIFSAARTVYALENALINEGFYTALFTRSNGQYARLGDALRAVKVQRNERNDQKYFLLGDPVMRLQIPQSTSQVTHLNGEPVENQPEKPLLKSLSTVSLSGVIRNGFGDIDTNFNGTALVNLYDSDVDKRVEDIDGTIHSYWVNGGLLSIAAAKVENGHFSTEFIVPKDISFSNSEGRLYIYAFDDDSIEFAMGSSKEFLVGGIDDNSVVDTEGPEIDIYLDNRNFESGDVASENPLLIVDLFDDSGINATGNGIGHDIQAWINTDPESISLTSDFAVSFEDFRRGTATRQLFDLPCGDHFIKVRAWDVYNNYSEKTSFFSIDCDGYIVVNETNAYPNPFSDILNLEVRHNSLDALSAQLYIYSVDGRNMYTSEPVTGQSLLNLTWNGLDSHGDSTPDGVYVYNIVLQGNNKLKTVTGTVVKMVQ